jgi:hypothetical protein
MIISVVNVWLEQGLIIDEYISIEELAAADRPAGPRASPLDQPPRLHLHDQHQIRRNLTL